MTPRARRLLAAAARSLLLHRLRSTLGALGVMIATAALVTMLAVGAGARAELLAQIEALGAANVLLQPTAPPPANLADAPAIMAAVTAQPGLATAVGALAETSHQVTVPGAAPAPVLAVSAPFLTIHRLAIAEGEPFGQLHEATGQRVCLVGSSLAARLGPAARPGAFLHLGGESWRVLGVLAPRGGGAGEAAAATLGVRPIDEAVLVPYGMHRTAAAEIWVALAPGRDPRIEAPQLARLAEIATRRSAPARVVVPEEILRQARRSRALFNVVLAIVAVLTLVVGAIGILNMMLANVTERRAEIGLRRAVGARRADIMAQFLAEALLLGGAGAAAGLVLGVIVSLALRLATGWPVAVGVWPVLAALVMALGCSVLAGVHPARVAARVPPAEALRG